MKVSELSEYQEKPEKIGIKVWDHVMWDGIEHILGAVGFNEYAAVSLADGRRYESSIFIKDAMHRNFTKSELEQILGDLDDWEVME